MKHADYEANGKKNARSSSGRTSGIPDFLKKYFKKRARINAIAVLVSLAGILLVAVIENNSRYPAVFTTYSDLESLYSKGLRYVTVEASAISSIRLESSHYFTQEYNPEDILRFYDGKIMVMGDLSNNEKTVVYSIRKNKPDYLRSRIDKMIDKLNENDYDTITQLEKLRRNIKPITLSYIDLTSVHHTATTMYIIFFIVLFTYSIKLYKSGIIFVAPKKSKTIQTLAQYGDPALLLEEYSRSLTGSEEDLDTGDIVINSKYLTLVYPLHIYIYPMKDLLWAFIAFRVYRGRKMASIYNTLRFCFSTKEEESFRIKSIDDGVNKLISIKALNPNVLIGFCPEFPEMVKSDFDRFKNQILTDVRVLQEKADIREHANIRINIYGADQEYI